MILIINGSPRAVMRGPCKLTKISAMVARQNFTPANDQEGLSWKKLS